MVFSTDERVSSALRSAHLTYALEAARRALTLTGDEDERSALTEAAATIARIELRARKTFADASTRQANLAAAALEG